MHLHSDGGHLIPHARVFQLHPPHQAPHGRKPKVMRESSNSRGRTTDIPSNPSSRPAFRSVHRGDSVTLVTEENVFNVLNLPSEVPASPRSAVAATGTPSFSTSSDNRGALYFVFFVIYFLFYFLWSVHRCIAVL